MGDPSLSQSKHNQWPVVPHPRHATSCRLQVLTPGHTGHTSHVTHCHHHIDTPPPLVFTISFLARILASWHPGILASWHMASRHPGIPASWHPGILASWHPGTLLRPNVSNVIICVCCPGSVCPLHPGPCAGVTHTGDRKICLSNRRVLFH